MGTMTKGRYFAEITHFYSENDSYALDSFLRTTKSEFVHQLSKDFQLACFLYFTGPATPSATQPAQGTVNEGGLLFARRNDSASTTEFFKE